MIGLGFRRVCGHLVGETLGQGRRGEAEPLEVLFLGGGRRDALQLLDVETEYCHGTIRRDCVQRKAIRRPANVNKMRPVKLRERNAIYQLKSMICLSKTSLATINGRGAFVCQTDTARSSAPRATTEQIFGAVTG